MPLPFHDEGEGGMPLLRSSLLQHVDADSENKRVQVFPSVTIGESFKLEMSETAPEFLCLQSMCSSKVFLFNKHDHLFGSCEVHSCQINSNFREHSRTFKNSNF